MTYSKAKYRVFWTTTETDFEGQLNALSQQGYSLAFWDYRMAKEQGETDVYHGVLKLDAGSYEGVTALRDVAPEEVDQYLAQGWEIASCSISTKFIRMINRKTLPANEGKVEPLQEATAQ